MRTRSIVLVLAFIATASLSAEDKQPVRSGGFAQKVGGYLLSPNSLKGSIGFVDCETGIDLAQIKKVIATIERGMPYNFKIVGASKVCGLPAVKDLKDNGIDIGIFIVNSDSLPPMLVAPECRWAVVNLTALRKGLKTDKLSNRLFDARCRGELMRAFGLVCGNGTSHYDGNVLCAANVEDLDGCDPDKLTYDMVQRATKAS